MMLDTTINLGTLLQTIGLISTFIYFIWAMKTELKVLETKQNIIVEDVKDMKLELGKLTEVTIEQAKQNTRLDFLEARIQELSKVR